MCKRTKAARGHRLVQISWSDLSPPDAMQKSTQMRLGCISCEAEITQRLLHEFKPIISLTCYRRPFHLLWCRDMHQDQNRAGAFIPWKNGQGAEGQNLLDRSLKEGRLWSYPQHNEGPGWGRKVSCPPWQRCEKSGPHLIILLKDNPETWGEAWRGHLQGVGKGVWIHRPSICICWFFQKPNSHGLWVLSNLF